MKNIISKIKFKLFHKHNFVNMGKVSGEKEIYGYDTPYHFEAIKLECRCGHIKYEDSI